MARSTRTKKVTPVQAVQYLMKAEEFLAVAEDCLVAERLVAATGNAVHAAINAADAVAGVRLGQRAAAEDHGQSVDLLARAGSDGQDLSRHLARLPLKTKAEYDPSGIPTPAARKAVEAARRAVGVARRVVPSA